MRHRNEMMSEDSEARGAGYSVESKSTEIPCQSFAGWDIAGGVEFPICISAQNLTTEPQAMMGPSIRCESWSSFGKRRNRPRAILEPATKRPLMLTQRFPLSALPHPPEAHFWIEWGRDESDGAHFHSALGWLEQVQERPL